MCDRLPGYRCPTDTRQAAEDTLAAYERAVALEFGNVGAAPMVDSLAAAKAKAGYLPPTRKEYDSVRDFRISKWTEQLRALRAKHPDMSEEEFTELAKRWRDEKIKSTAARRLKQLEKRKRVTPQVVAEMESLRRVLEAPTSALPGEAQPKYASPDEEYLASRPVAGTHDGVPYRKVYPAELRDMGSLVGRKAVITGPDGRDSVVMLRPGFDEDGHIERLTFHLGGPEALERGNTRGEMWQAEGDFSAFPMSSLRVLDEEPGQAKVSAGTR